jgi:hypothetical protein
MTTDTWYYIYIAVTAVILVATIYIMREIKNNLLQIPTFVFGLAAITLSILGIINNKNYTDAKAIPKPTPEQKQELKKLSKNNDTYIIWSPICVIFTVLCFFASVTF